MEIRVNTETLSLWPIIPRKDEAKCRDSLGRIVPAEDTVSGQGICVVSDGLNEVTVQGV